MTPGGMSETETVTVDSSADIAVLSPRVRSIKGRNIGNAELSAIAHFPELEVLDLSGCEQITDLGLASLVVAHRLRELNLTGCEEVTDDGMMYVAQLGTL